MKTKSESQELNLWYSLVGLISIVLLVGLGYGLYITIANLIFNFAIIVLVLFLAITLTSIGHSLQNRGWRSKLQMPNGEIHVSSPLIVDLTKGLGYLTIAIFFIIILSQPSYITLPPFIIATFTILITIGIGLFCFRKILDRNDKIVIGDNFISIDQKESTDVHRINRSDIIKIISFNLVTRRRTSSYESSASESYLKFLYNSNTNDQSKENHITIQPDDDLNVSRDLIVKALLEKGYEVHHE